MEDKQIIIIALDIETNGSYVLKNEIISIGYCIGDEDGNVKVKGRFDLEATSAMEQRCQTEFWSKHMDKYAALQKDAISQAEGAYRFMHLIDDLDEKYKLRIIVDNPAFDVKFIDVLLERHLGRRPLHYKHNKHYRSIYDIDSYTRGVLGLQLSDMWTDDKQLIEKFSLKIDANHTHMPDDDAEYIYKYHAAVLKAVRQRNALLDDLRKFTDIGKK